HHGAGGIQRHKSDVGTRAKQMLIRNQLGFYAVASYVESAGNWLGRRLLRPSGTNRRENQPNGGQNPGDDGLDYCHGFAFLANYTAVLTGNPYSLCTSHQVRRRGQKPQKKPASESNMQMAEADACLSRLFRMV
ncbi:MAG TPA: hypothetical protein VLB68_11175, partial [Pyrinomonadaceae bacterium]|nr:hypothetical protein [Pyrinomonadaceae bacterium]